MPSSALQNLTSVPPTSCGCTALSRLRQSTLAPHADFSYKPGMPVTATRVGARHPGSFDLTAYLAECSDAINRALDGFLPAANTRPETLHKAMRYSLFAG